MIWQITSLFVNLTTSRYLGALLHQLLAEIQDARQCNVLLILRLRDESFPGIV
jgi:hypothetical protein